MKSKENAAVAARTVQLILETVTPEIVRLVSDELIMALRREGHTLANEYIEKLRNSAREVSYLERENAALRQALTDQYTRTQEVLAKAFPDLRPDDVGPTPHATAPGTPPSGAPKE